MPAEVKYPDEYGRPLLQSGVGERIWALKDTDKQAFMREFKEYFARGLPGWTVVRAKYPIIFLRDDRRSSNA
jgi:hypothetical protein